MLRNSEMQITIWSDCVTYDLIKLIGENYHHLQNRSFKNSSIFDAIAEKLKPQVNTFINILIY